MKTLSSPILFKQIFGRGSRIDQATEKYWFRIIDFTGATRLFDQWDRPAGPPPQPPVGPFTATLTGYVFHFQTGERIVGARISVRTGPNTQQGPILTGENGAFNFTRLPAGHLTVICSAPGFASRELRVETLADETVTVEVPLKPDRKSAAKIRVKGLEVTIADEAVFLIEETGQQLTLAEYRGYTRRHITRAAPTLTTLRAIWVDAARRRAFLEDLRRQSIHPEVLAEAMGQSEADTFDLLAHLAFGAPIRTRSERAAAFRNREQAFIHSFSENARRVILELLEKYRVGGIEELRPEVFSVSPFREWGGAFTISRWFGTPQALHAVMSEMQQRIYPETEVVA